MREHVFGSTQSTNLRRKRVDKFAANFYVDTNILLKYYSCARVQSVFRALAGSLINTHE